MRGFYNIGLIIVTLLLLAACSTTKFVGDDEFLLDKVRIESDNKDYSTTTLRSYLRQTPNFKAFGLMKWQLYVYNWSGKNEKNWVNKQLRRMGEAPIIMDTLLTEQSSQELQRFLINKGYINAHVSSSVDTTRQKKAIVTYYVKSNEPYRIREYDINLTDQVIDSIAHLKTPYRSSLSTAFRSAPEGFTSLVKEEGLFDRDVLDEERQRITSLLRRRGYYAFNREHLAYLADSSFNQNIVDVEMQLRAFRMMKSDGSVVDTTHRQYYINDVTVLTDYDALGLDELGNRIHVTDSVKSGDISILYGKEGRSIRPGVLRRSTYITPGRLYNERSVEQTYSSFTSLRALKNVNIRFSEFEENDTMKLNCTILTAPAKLQSVGFDVEGTNSAGDFGFASSVNYQHRNLFKGAEIFSARVRGAYESLTGDKGSGLSNYWEIGADASITFPQFLFPFVSYDFKRRLRASTELKVSYNRQTRPEYKRDIISGGWSYIWQSRNNSQARHVFKLLDIDYVSLPRLDADFINSLPPAIVLYNYSDQFIMGAGYTYSFNNYNPLNRQRNSHSIRISLETAGNLLNAFSKVSNSKKSENGLYEIFNINYAQFVKTDVDLSKGVILDDRNKIAFHVGVGVACPYGNGKRIPFERQYFSGGANSVRGWSVRSLGPGAMLVSDSTSFALRAGDIRLDANVEYRTKLFWKFEMAAYLDAGNIWTIRKYDEKPDGNFDFSRFYREIAFSYGLGLRLDFDFFLLRFDTGFKAYNPHERGAKRWAIKEFNFTDNFAWHFAVGYPF